jgi:transcriptional regulator with XRE-family HTH domain
MDEPDWARMVTAVKERRLALGLSAREAANQAGINRATWSTMEGGERRLSRHLWSPVERVLLWEPGSIEQILAGGDPTPQEDQPVPAKPSPPSGPDLEEELNAAIEQAVRLDVSPRTRLNIISNLMSLYEQAKAKHQKPDRGAG